jgi:hypothetical protein
MVNSLLSMVLIKYPEHSFRLKETNGKEFIFDELRKLWVRLTPEEWVRQNLLQYLVQVKQYPASLIAVETEIKLNGLRKRCDIVVYKEHTPWMIIECKEMNVPLTSSVLEQVLRYNIRLAVSFIAITNGSQVHIWQLENGSATELEAFPAFN